MEKVINKVLSFFHFSVYVVTAYDPYRERNKEVRVYFSLQKAQDEFTRLKPIYGPRNVAYHSREIL